MLRVAVHQSEQYSARLRSCVHGLERRVVPTSSLPELPVQCPTFILGPEAPQSAFLSPDNGEACGILKVNLPSCNIEEGTNDVLETLMLQSL